MAGNKHTSIMLQERDLRLLEALEDMQVLDRKQASVVGGFTSPTRAKGRLLALTKAGHLKRAFIGRRQAVYWLADRPLRETKRGDVTAEPASLFLRHRLEINRLRLLVQYSGIPVPGWWFIRWQSFRKSLSPTIPLIPDGYLEIGSGRGSRSAFVEIDLGTEAVPVLSRKASLYLQLATSGEFPQIFGSSQFRVLLLTTSERRLQNIRQAIAKLTDKIFWFGTLDLLSPEKFWNASWLRPTGDQLQSLV